MGKEVYTHKDGTVVALAEFNDTYFKVNIPVDEEDFIYGLGEGIWCCSTNEGYSKWANDDSVGEIIYVKVLNDPIYYGKMQYLDIIPVETRGKNRPVALLDELIAKYGKGCNPLNEAK